MKYLGRNELHAIDLCENEGDYVEMELCGRAINLILLQKDEDVKHWAFTWPEKKRYNPALKMDGIAAKSGTGSIGGWRDSEIRRWCVDEILAGMDTDLRKRCVDVFNRQIAVEQSGERYLQCTCDTIWLLDVDELLARQGGKSHMWIKNFIGNRIWWARSAGDAYDFKTYNGELNEYEYAAQRELNIMLGICTD